jgi:manganese transport protein
VLSQVALSFVLPFAIIPLMYFTSRRDVMDDMVNRRWTTILGWLVTTIIIALNLFLLYQTYAGR